MTAQVESRRGGVGLLSLLGLLFIGLKLGGVINWSWWLVLLPLYGPLALVLIIAFVVLVVAGIVTLARR